MPRSDVKRRVTSTLRRFLLFDPRHRFFFLLTLLLSCLSLSHHSPKLIGLSHLSAASNCATVSGGIDFSSPSNLTAIMSCNSRSRCTCQILAAVNYL